jgi:hypothetical protein
VKAITIAAEPTAPATTSSPRFIRQRVSRRSTSRAKGAVHQTDLDLMLRNRRHRDPAGRRRHHRGLRPHHGARANDRGYRCVVLADCCAPFYDFHTAGLAMIKAQGGIFGWVTASQAVLGALAG